MSANEAIGAIGSGDKTGKTEQIDYRDYYRQNAENQNQKLRPNSIWVNEGAYIT